MRKSSFYSLMLLFSLIPFKNIFAYEYMPRGDQDASQEIMDLEATVDNHDEPKKIQHPLLYCKKCWFVSVGVGAASATAKNSENTIDNGSGFPPPGNVDQYTANGSNPWAALFSADFGYLFIEPGWPKAVSFGMRYRFLLDSKVEGNTIEESNPTIFNNYNFTLSSDTK